MSGRRFTIAGTLALLALTGITGCAGDDDHSGLRMAPLDELPREVQEAPQAVRESYQFAVANPELLQALPCYCGCGGMGHTSNLSCYASTASDSAVRFDHHALGCSICVDITLDAKRMLREGKDLAEIRSYVDIEYSKYGPSNMPPPPSHSVD